jgi:DNA-binding response OmpR family regulator
MRKTILLVEDEKHIRMALSIDLETSGNYHILEAGDRDEALRIMENNTPDLVLTDIMMPSSRQAGLELISDFRNQKKWKNIPIIVLSARTMSEDILDALKRGANDYLIKPYEPEDLFSRVQRSLEFGSISETEVHEFGDEKQKQRQLLVDTIKLSLLYWELTTGKSKLDLAEESGIWSVYMDRFGSRSTKTLDRYMKIQTLPQKPRTLQVIRTADYVLKVCSEDDVIIKPRLLEQVHQLEEFYNRE